MDKKKVTLIVSILVIILSVILSIMIITNKKDEKESSNVIDGITLPETKDILKDTTIENLKITNISLLTRDGRSTYKAQISNETDKDITIDTLYVIFYGSNKEESNKVPALKNSTIKANDKTYINISFETDLSKTSKIEYSIENNQEEE